MHEKHRPPERHDALTDRGTARRQPPAAGSLNHPPITRRNSAKMMREYTSLRDTPTSDPRRPGNVEYRIKTLS
jgi:hypothetical protein